MLKRITVLLLTLAYMLPGRAAPADSTGGNYHALAINAGYAQIKEGHNLGLVFGGLLATNGYVYQHRFKKSILRYQLDLGGGVLFCRGMKGFVLHAVPVDLHYWFLLKDAPRIKVYLGANLAAIYNYQIYLDLQSGHSYWFTDYHLSPTVLVQIPVRKNHIELMASTSVFGLVSRPPAYRDPYFFGVQASDFLKNAHSGFQAGSFNLLNHTEVTAAYTFYTRRCNYKLGYRFRYFGYYKQTTLSALDHSLVLQFQFKRKQK